jgi:hypothetical protein
VVTVLATSALAATAAVLQGTVFRYGSIDLDDLDYRNQAAALRHGETTLPAASHTPFFLPYLTGIHDGRVVFTHQPLWAGFLAAFELLRLSTEVAVAASAALGALAAAALVREVIEDRTVRIVATLLLVLSPVVLVQSGTLLGYLPTLILGMGASALVLRSLRLVSYPCALAGGFVAGLSVFNRPYDAVLFLVPLGLYCVFRLRQSELRILVLWMVVGSLPPLAAMLAYNGSVMGSVFRFPYSVHPLDTIGFGRRASFGTHTTTFGPARAWSGLANNVHELIGWTVGGAAGLVLAGIGLIAGRRNGRLWIVAGWVLTFPLGYFFFWTSWNIARFRLIAPLGPFYYLGSLAGLAVLAGVGLVTVARWRPAAAVGVALVMAGLSAWTVQSSVSQNLGVRSTLAARQALLSKATATPRIVLIEPLFTDPYVDLQNPPDLGGPVLYALNLGFRSPMALAHAYPTDHLYEEAGVHTQNGLFRPAEQVLRKLSLRSTGRASFGLAFRPPAIEATLPVETFARLGAAGPGAAQPVTAVHGTYAATWSLTPGGVSFGGTVVPIPVDRTVQLRIGMSEGGNGSIGHGYYEYRYSLRSNGKRVTLVLPGAPWREYVFPGDRVAQTQEDLRGVLSVDVG